jgi:predicted outer membrane repeat protein
MAARNRTNRLGPSLVVLAIALAPGASRAATFSVGTGCTHPTLAAAILAAYLSPEDDLIKVTQALTNQSVVIEDFRQDVRGRVTIRGGYDSCGDTTSSGRTVIDGISSQPIFRVETSTQTLSTAILENLELSGAARGAAVLEGGQLTLNDVLITNNRDGGVLVDGGTLVTNSSTDIKQNGWLVPTPITGGGILCTNGGLLILDGDIDNNRAELGGGVALYSGCNAELQPGLWIIANSADSNGGGLYVTSGTAVVGDGDGVVIDIAANHAARGGGLYVDGTGVVVLQDAAFTHNTADHDGGAIYALNGANVTLAPSTGCPELVLSACNRIVSNLLGDDDGRGSAVYVSSAAVTLRRLRVAWQQGGLPQFRVPLFYAGGATGELVLENLVVSGNYATNLIEADTGAEVIAGYVSAADNFYQSGSTFSSAVSATGGGTEIGVFSSILWDLQGFFVTSGATLELDCLITNTLTGVPPGSFAVANDNPQFLAPTTDDLRVGPSSPAVDFCDLGAYPFPGAPDFDGLSRPADRPDNTNGSPGLDWGTIDVGAFELQLGATPFLFADGFESGNTLAWSTATG